MCGHWSDDSGKLSLCMPLTEMLILLFLNPLKTINVGNDNLKCIILSHNNEGMVQLYMTWFFIICLKCNERFS